MSAAPLIQFPRAELRDLVQDLTDLKTIWNYEPHPFVGVVNGEPGAFIELSVIAMQTKGIDEVRYTFDPVNQVNGVTQISLRIYTIQFKVISYNKDRPAYDIMDQVRRGLRSLTAKTGYVEIGLAFVDWNNSRDLVEPHDNRGATTSTLDVRLSWSVAADPGDDSGTIIEKVQTIDGSGLVP